MNFNLVLDYFNNKGKQRSNIERIKEALDIMEEITSKPSIENRDEAVSNNKASDRHEQRIDTGHGSNDELKPIDVEEDLKVHNKIVTEDLMTGFKDLFASKHASENSNSSTHMVRRIADMDSLETSRSASRAMSRMNTLGKVLPTHISTIKTNTINTDRSNYNDENKTKMNNLYNKNGGVNANMPFSNFIRQKMAGINPLDMKQINYEKYVNMMNTKINKKSSTPSSTRYSNLWTKTTVSKFHKTGTNFGKNAEDLSNRSHHSNISILPNIKGTDHIPNNIMNELFPRLDLSPTNRKVSMNSTISAHSQKSNFFR